MAKPDKAQVTYTTDSGVEQVLKFHTVIAEEHEASSEITKFPVQSGFNVSNNKIRKNGKVSITGAMTNHLIAGSETAYELGGNNCRIMFSTLKALVNNGTPCDVLTNYGSYSPVIFTRLKTKLVAGKTDSMEFVLSGEEVQIGSTANSTTPQLIPFTVTSGASREAIVAELDAVGITVIDSDEVSQAQINILESFKVATVNASGESITTTYEASSADVANGLYTYKVHTSDVETYDSSTDGYIDYISLMSEHSVSEVEEETVTSLPSSGLESAYTGASTALLRNSTEDTVDKSTKGIIRTPLGYSIESVYGAEVSNTVLSANSPTGQILDSVGTNSLVLGSVGSVNAEEDEESLMGTDFPTSDDAISGAEELGNTDESTTISATLIKVTPYLESSATYLGDIL